MHQPAAPWMVRHFRRHQHLARPGQVPDSLFRVEDGWACRYRLLSAGRRQITALFLPGEYCEPQWLLGGSATAPIVALTPLQTRAATLADLTKAGGLGHEGSAGMAGPILQALGRQSDWIVSLGRKTAAERLCALLSDIYDRLGCAGRVIGRDRCTMPLTQAELADVVGLTPVHVNRVLQHLRAQDLIELRGGLLRVLDPVRLRQIGSASCPPEAEPKESLQVN